MSIYVAVGLILLALSCAVWYRAGKYNLPDDTWGVFVRLGRISYKKGPEKGWIMPFISHLLILPANQSPIMLKKQCIPTKRGSVTLKGRLNIEITDPLQALIKVKNIRQVAADLVAALIFRRISQGMSLKDVEDSLRGHTSPYLGIKITEINLTEINKGETYFTEGEAEKEYDKNIRKEKRKKGKDYEDYGELIEVVLKAPIHTYSLKNGPDLGESRISEKARPRNPQNIKKYDVNNLKRGS